MHIDIIWIYLNGVRHGDSFRRATFIGKLSAIQSRLQDMNILKGRIEAAKARPVVWRSQVLEIRGVTQWYDMDWYGMLFYAYYTYVFTFLITWKTVWWCLVGMQLFFDRRDTR